MGEDAVTEYPDQPAEFPTWIMLKRWEYYNEHGKFPLPEINW